MTFQTRNMVQALSAWNGKYAHFCSSMYVPGIRHRSHSQFKKLENDLITAMDNDKTIHVEDIERRESVCTQSPTCRPAIPKRYES